MTHPLQIHHLLRKIAQPGCIGSKRPCNDWDIKKENLLIIAETLDTADLVFVTLVELQFCADAPLELELDAPLAEMMFLKPWWRTIHL